MEMGGLSLGIRFSLRGLFILNFGVSGFFLPILDGAFPAARPIVVIFINTVQFAANITRGLLEFADAFDKEVGILLEFFRVKH